MNVKIAPSLMCMDMMNVREQMKVLKRADYLHVDIIDWHYVRNMCLAPVFMQQLAQITDVPMDAHLMVDNVDTDLVGLCLDSGAGAVSFDPNVVQPRAFRLLDQIKNVGKMAGVFINPAMPLDIIYPYIHILDMITFMTVDPGYAGQRFIEESLGKMTHAKRLKEEKGYTYEIQVDGSCNSKTYKKLYDAGAEIFVVGTSGLFNNDPDLARAWEIMEQDITGQIG
ncbi:MAG TPA: allulose-6-phosphate 3-epimerase [Clostridiales bacterium]|nr:allulose-6-phosphate 3-epimerase [Clostridiales bacterium]